MMEFGVLLLKHLHARLFAVDIADFVISLILAFLHAESLQIVAYNRVCISQGNVSND